ncbi:MAG: germination protein Ger(x)C family, partial [Clostridia bacterium]|nr:germination protein Ger(x)C family [Clostridia bacterium]
MKRHHKILILTVICCSLLTGCWDQRIFEEVGLILTVGIEESEDGKLLINYAYPAIGAVEQKAVNTSTQEATLIRAARENSRLSSPNILEGGKVQQILLSDSLAKTGVHDILELFQRDVSLPAIAYIVIVEGSPIELLQKSAQFKNFPRVSIYLFQLLDNNVQLSNIPNTKIFDFDINFFAPGLDPVVPMIKLGENDVHITGSALFSKDKMVGKLDMKQTLMLIALMDQAKTAEYILSDPEFTSDVPLKYGISVSLYKPKRKIKINFDDEGLPIFDISISYKCVLDEYKWNQTNSPPEQKKLESA